MTRTAAYFQSGIGNLIVATPALQALAEMDPAGKIDVVMSPEWKDSRRPAVLDLFRQMPFVNEVVEFPGKLNGKYERYFIPVQSEQSPAGYCILGRIEQHHGRWPGVNWMQGIHEVDANMRMVRKMGYDKETPPLFVPVAEKPVLDLPRPIIGVCNGAFATSVWDKKRWPHFAPLVEVLREWYRGSVVGVGGVGEMEGVPLDADFCGRLSFTETAKVISQCDLFISTDTGCMHAADAIGIPTLALFGSTLITKNGPVGKRSHVVKSRVECAPCQYTDAFFVCSTYRCMEQIDVPDVMRIARRVLR